jgi:hypothetical protein
LGTKEEEEEEKEVGYFPKFIECLISFRAVIKQQGGGGKVNLRVPTEINVN